MHAKGFSLIELTLCLILLVGLGALTYKPPTSIAQKAVVQPGTAFGTNDSIDLICMAAPTGSCVKLGTALSKSADFVRVNGVQVQKPYSALHEANLALQCGTRSN